MAKGFTVKAKSPKKKAATVPEFDYVKAKEMIKGKTVVFCLPGRGVSYTFLKNLKRKVSNLHFHVEMVAVQVVQLK